ncbi:MAG: ABC transporter permease subunit [Oscillospiraceae bacterium]|nr:ABC transporter permease subunit [Oscillospiraceae bacterium]
MQEQHRPKINAIPALVFWLLIWQLASGAMGNILLLPSPLQVLLRLGRMAVTADFWQTTVTSIGRILLGVSAATALGVLLAVFTSRFRLLELLVAPAMTAMQATPVASFTILVLIWIDRDFVPVLICGMMVLPVIWNSVSTGIRVTDKQLLEMGKVFRLPVLTRLRRIWIPSVMPFFRSACSSALGLGWKAGIAAEVLTVPKASIGRMISESKLYLLTEELFAWTLAVVLLSLLLQKLMLAILKGRGSDAEAV